MGVHVPVLRCAYLELEQVSQDILRRLYRKPAMNHRGRTVESRCKKLAEQQRGAKRRENGEEMKKKKKIWKTG